MMNIYLRRGYLIVYMAGRPRQMDVLGKSMCQATLDWLEANGFPTDPGDTLLLLRDGSQAVVDAKDRGTAMGEWMGEHGTDLFRSMVEGVKEQYAIVPSYGYVDSDDVADAFLASGVPAAHPQRSYCEISPARRSGTGVPVAAMTAGGAPRVHTPGIACQAARVASAGRISALPPNMR
jgi:hypothetical protein